MSSSYKPFSKWTWNTPDGKPPAAYRRKEDGEASRKKLSEQQPAKELSPPPPVYPVIGESDGQPEAAPATQDVEAKEVMKSASGDDRPNFHHRENVAAESENEDPSAGDDASADDVTSSESTDWDAVAEALKDLTGEETDAAEEADVVKVTRRNTQKLTPSEEDRFLMCLTYGLSMRQAAAAVGCHHTTLVKRAQRDKAFAELIERAKSKARTDPLIEVTQASRKSWRAAAWLLQYLERRDNRGGSKAKAS